MTTYLSGNEITERESLLATMAVLSVAECPLIRSLPHIGLDSRLTEFTADEPFYDADNVRSPGNPHQNTRLEGAAFVEDTARYPLRLRAIAEINHFGKKISNSDRVAMMAGVTDPYNYRAHQLYVKLLNNVENVTMYGTGSPEVHGGGDELRKAMGLIFGCAWTGLERVHGSGATDSIDDPMGVKIPKEFWSTFFDANGTSLSRKMLYEKILANANRAGTHIPGILFHVGAKLKVQVADIGITPAGEPVNQRNVDASGLMTYDDIDWIRTPLGIIGFRTNRYLDIEGSTFAVGGDAAPPSPSTQIRLPMGGGFTSPASYTARTFQADETMIGWMPGYVAMGWYRAPHYQQISHDGDFTRVMACAEYTPIVRHPKGLLGGGNLLG